MKHKTWGPQRSYWSNTGQMPPTGPEGQISARLVHRWQVGLPHYSLGSDPLHSLKLIHLVSPGFSLKMTTCNNTFSSWTLTFSSTKWCFCSHYRIQTQLGDTGWSPGLWSSWIFLRISFFTKKHEKWCVSHLLYHCFEDGDVFSTLYGASSKFPQLVILLQP